MGSEKASSVQGQFRPGPTRRPGQGQEVLLLAALDQVKSSGVTPGGAPAAGRVHKVHPHPPAPAPQAQGPAHAGNGRQELITGVGKDLRAGLRPQQLGEFGVDGETPHHPGQEGGPRAVLGRGPLRIDPQVRHFLERPLAGPAGASRQGCVDVRHQVAPRCWASERAWPWAESPASRRTTRR